MKVVIAILVIILAASGLFFIFRGNGQPVDEETASSTPQSVVASYNLADVATHASQKDCWSAISGNVYNLTTWVSEHPGGEEAILSICGKDASLDFSTQHGGSKKQAELLTTFFVGILK